MAFTVACSCRYLAKLGLSLIIISLLLWNNNNTAECCENSTAPDAATLGAAIHHLSLSSCVSEIVRAICGALKPLPIKRNTELINSILGLPRVLQDAGR